MTTNNFRQPLGLEHSMAMGEQPETLLKGVGKGANRGSEASIPAALSVSGGPGTARHIPKDVQSQSKWVGKWKEEQA